MLTRKMIWFAVVLVGLVVFALSAVVIFISTSPH